MNVLVDLVQVKMFVEQVKKGPLKRAVVGCDGRCINYAELNEMTDFLARHFEKLVFKGLGLDRFPKLRDVYFGNYRRMVYLVQRENAENLTRAEAAAASIGLELEVRHTGYGGYQQYLESK